MRLRDNWMRAFDAAVETIVKLSTEASEVREQLIALVAGMHSGGLGYSECVGVFKKTFIGHVLDKHHGNQSKAARELGMHRNSLSRNMAELNMRAEDFAPRKPVGAERVQQIRETANRA